MQTRERAAKRGQRGHPSASDPPKIRRMTGELLNRESASTQGARAMTAVSRTANQLLEALRRGTADVSVCASVSGVVVAPATLMGSSARDRAALTWCSTTPGALIASETRFVISLHDIDRPTLLSETFRLYADRRLGIYYAPFDRVNTRARLVLVGVTPGWTQMEIAYRTARQGLLEGHEREAILSSVKRAARFAGSMRVNLVTMLDDLGLPATLGVSMSSLFDERDDLLHSTSAIRYPVFVDGRNYTGHQPRPLDVSILTAFVEEQLSSELASVDGALIVPLGDAVERCLDFLVRRHQLPRERCLFGFPHPSGANGHRARHFAERRDELRRTLREWFASAERISSRAPSG